MAAKGPKLRLIKGGKTPASQPPAPPTIIFDQRDITDNFYLAEIKHGMALTQTNRVKKCHVSAYQKGSHIQKLIGLVDSPQRHQSYRVSLTATVETETQTGDARQAVVLEGKCSCSSSANCRHAAALALDALSTHRYCAAGNHQKAAYDILLRRSKALQPKRTSTNPIAQWSSALTTYQNAPASVHPPTDEAVVYLLSVPTRQQGGLKIVLERARVLKRGGYGKSRELTLHSEQAKAMITPEDKAILNQFYALQEAPSLDNSEFHFLLKNCDAVLEALLATGKAYWSKTSKHPLTRGETRPLEPRWDIDRHGAQSLGLYPPGSDASTTSQLLPTQPGWYYDSTCHQLGQVDTALPADVLVWLQRLPDIPPDQVQTAQEQLQTLLPNATALPPLHPIHYAPVEKSLKPVVRLRLYGQHLTPDPEERLERLLTEEQRLGGRNFFDNLVQMFGMAEEDDEEGFDDYPLALAECQFDYQGHRVSLADAEDRLEFFSDGQLHTVVRNRPFERECVEKLGQIGLEPAALQPHLIAQDNALQFAFVINDAVEDEAVIAEQLSTLQSLANQEGWEVVLESSFPTRIIHDIDEWYTELETSTSGMDWFSLRLGVMVGGEPVNILPLLLHQITTQFKGLNANAIKQLPDTTPCELRMENGEYLRIPFPRIRNILLVLCELFEDKPLDEAGKLRLSRLKASLLPEIEKAVGATRLRWFGETQLKQFGEKLTHFQGIQSVAPAKNFTATLRPYQQEGLNWLQFLREFRLNGILADDMGLGKTIQTLAHLTVEKESGRLNHPSLLIAPTSLMTNWENEIQRFAPDLTWLVLHGHKRHQHFERMEQVDVILTTYPLVIRDKATLLKPTYQYLILDEAQQIKNAQAKVTQIILQMKATHRLCLTGTPMENHLGELWSLFHFILPGLLGTKAQFSQVFRTPIEKQGDQMRHQQLIQRIKPFMLRRRKDDVAQDLPEKTEIVRKIEFAQEQRDLYESVRLAMEQKVRQVVNAQGLNSSQIIILDALLKLRQICCAPLLLKLPQAQQVKQSAKLADLMEFLPNLIEEGRRILLFSSFTSMLAMIEERLIEQGIAHVKLTGQTKDRKAPIRQFQNQEVPLFLISLKAGGVGLNLTAADTVIHYDPWWNPAAEQQATDRAHRIGQKNPVFVYKMIVEGTVEECILDMQAKKREIIDSTLESNKQTKLSLTPQDLENLFKPIQQDSS